MLDFVRNLFPNGRVKKERQEADDDTQLKPADLALGVVKIVLTYIDLHEQPKGKYFCIFKWVNHNSHKLDFAFHLFGLCLLVCM